MKITIEENGSETYTFEKGEGLSITTYYDNNPHGEENHDEEDYPVIPELFNGKMSLDDYLIENFSGNYCMVYSYRSLTFGEDDYESGGATGTLCFISSDEVNWNPEVPDDDS